MSGSRLLGLYLRSRRTVPALVALLGVTAATWALLDLVDDRVVTKLILIILPLAPAAIVGAALYSPFGETERTASRPFPILRLAQLALLLAIAGAGAAIANLPALGEDFRWLLVRNGAGYVGLALLGARLGGATRAWILPFLYGLFVVVSPGNALSRTNRWLWPLQPPAEQAALVIALLVLLGGLLVGIIAGPRAMSDESPQ